MSTSSKHEQHPPDGALKIGIAGLGFGAGVHLPVFSSLSGVEIVSVLARNADKTRTVAARFGVQAHCVSTAEFLDRELDAVVISLPPQPAGALAAAVLDRGIAVLGEKPIAATADEATTLATRAATLTTMVDFEFRELPSFKALRRSIVDGAFGRIVALRISWHVLSYAQQRRIWSWKSDAARGGGVLTLSGLHLFDLLQWLFGSVVPERARLDDTATRQFTPPGCRPAADSADIVLRCDDDIIVHAGLCNAARESTGHRWEIDTERGMVTLEDDLSGLFSAFTLAITPRRGKRRLLAQDPARSGDYRIGPVSSLAERFIAAVRRGERIAPTFSDGARAQRMMEMVCAVSE